MDSGGGPPRRATASVGGGAAPAVGDRVVLGLVSRSDLNGKADAATALDLARLRAGVKVEGPGR